MSEAHHNQFEYVEEPYIVIQSQKLNVESLPSSNEIDYYVQLKSNVDLSAAVPCTISYSSSNLSVINDDVVKSFTKGTAKFEFTDLYRIVKIRFKARQNANSTNIIKFVKYPDEQNGIPIVVDDGFITIKR